MPSIVQMLGKAFLFTKDCVKWDVKCIERNTKETKKETQKKHKRNKERNTKETKKETQKKQRKKHKRNKERNTKETKMERENQKIKDRKEERRKSSLCWRANIKQKKTCEPQTLVGLNRENPVLDPLAVQHLGN